MHRAEITYKVFRGLKFPQILTLVVPSTGHYILPAFPNVKAVTCIGACPEVFWGTLFAHCPNVVSLGTFEGTDCTKVIKVVAERLPNLEKITFDIRNPTLTPEAISNLSALKRLHTVCFDVNEGYHLTPGNTGNWFTIIDFMHKRKAVMVAFQNIPQRDGFQKRLVVKYERQSEVYIFDATPS